MLPWRGSLETNFPALSPFLPFLFLGYPTFGRFKNDLAWSPSYQPDLSDAIVKVHALLLFLSLLPHWKKLFKVSHLYQSL